MPLSLVRAKTDDLKYVQQCARAAYSLYVERIGREPAPMVADFKNAITEGAVDLLVVDAQNIGYAITYKRAECLFIENIAIHPDHQGNGFAKELFETLETRARSANLTMMELYTNEKMVENLGLYAHLGFLETERRTEDGFHRVYFRKSIGAE